MGKVTFLGVCKQAHSLFGKLYHQHDSYFSIAYWGRKVKSKHCDVECDTCVLLHKMLNSHYFEMMDVENVIVSFAQLPPSSIVQGFGRRNITILCPLSRVVFIVVAWQWASQFF